MESVIQYIPNSSLQKLTDKDKFNVLYPWVKLQPPYCSVSVLNIRKKDKTFAHFLGNRLIRTSSFYFTETEFSLIMFYYIRPFTDIVATFNSTLYIHLTAREQFITMQIDVDIY